MDKTKVKQLVEEMEQNFLALQEELEAVKKELEAKEETEVAGDKEQLLFDVRCLEDNGRAVECDDWIYYINQIDDVECGDIWKVRTNGEDNQLLLSSLTPAKAIRSVDGKWIHYNNHYNDRYKVTIYGKMNQVDTEDE